MKGTITLKVVRGFDPLERLRLCLHETRSILSPVVWSCEYSPQEPSSMDGALDALDAAIAANGLFEEVD